MPQNAVHQGTSSASGSPAAMAAPWPRQDARGAVVEQRQRRRRRQAGVLGEAARVEPARIGPGEGDVVHGDAPRELAARQARLVRDAAAVRRRRPEDREAAHARVRLGRGPLHVRR